MSTTSAVRLISAETSTTTTTTLENDKTLNIYGAINEDETELLYVKQQKEDPSFQTHESLLERIATLESELFQVKQGGKDVLIKARERLEQLMKEKEEIVRSARAQAREYVTKTTQQKEQLEQQIIRLRSQLATEKENRENTVKERDFLQVLVDQLKAEKLENMKQIEHMKQEISHLQTEGQNICRIGKRLLNTIDLSTFTLAIYENLAAEAFEGKATKSGWLTKQGLVSMHVFTSSP